MGRDGRLGTVSGAKRSAGLMEDQPKLGDQVEQVLKAADMVEPADANPSGRGVGL